MLLYCNDDDDDDDDWVGLWLYSEEEVGAVGMEKAWDKNGISFIYLFCLI